jgi:radical SAM family RiPP maturation amino acid epimerase
MTVADITDHDPVARMRVMLAARTPDEVRVIARAKRAIELCDINPALRQAIIDAPDSAGTRLARAGAPRDIDLDGLRPLFERAALPLYGEDGPADLADWPDPARLYRSWLNDLFGLRATYRRRAMAGGETRFHAWQARQVARCDSALPAATAQAITHPVVALELARGCSVGCWFCGIDAARFQGTLHYSPHEAARWRDLLAVLAQWFGPALQTGVCYWATDPADTPDYDRFIADVHDACGALPQTTTAAPLRDVALTRRVLELARDRDCPTANRFSILTPRQLAGVHEAFTADELLTVSLIIQTRDSRVVKAPVGRMRRHAAIPEDAADETIACVTGLLINVPEGRLRLISPTPPSQRWPLGYRIHAEGTFQDAAGLNACLEQAMTKATPVPTWPDAPLSWREDLSWSLDTDSRPRLTNRHRVHTLSGPPALAGLGGLLAQGAPRGALMNHLMGQGVDVLVATQLLEDLIAAGLVEGPTETIRVGEAGPASVPAL